MAKFVYYVTPTRLSPRFRVSTSLANRNIDLMAASSCSSLPSIEANLVQKYAGPVSLDFDCGFEGSGMARRLQRIQIPLARKLDSVRTDTSGQSERAGRV